MDTSARPYEKTLTILKKALVTEIRDQSKGILSDSLNDSWVIKTWGKITRADLATGTSKHSYFDILKLARKKAIPSLEKKLAANSFRDLIMELVLQILEYRVYNGRPDVLFAIEVGLELAQMSNGRADHTMLLNAFHRQPGSFDKLSNLLKKESPVDKWRRTHTKADESVEMDVTGSSIHLTASNLVSDSQLLKVPGNHDSSTDSKALSGNSLLENSIVLEQSSDNEQQSRKMLIKLWAEVNRKIENRLAKMRAGVEGSNDKRELLWKRMEDFEAMIDDVYADVKNPEENGMLVKAKTQHLPAFKSLIQKKISNAPEMADAVFDTLDKLLDHDVTLGEFVELAARLADVEKPDTLTAVYEDLNYGAYGDGVYEYILGTLAKSR